MYKQLTSEQRYTISVLLQNRTKQKDIAKAINVSASTVSREIRRNSGVRRHYNWETAQANAVQTRRRKPGNRSVDKDVMEEAKRLLITEQWSPEQISGVLAKDGKYISHETIYRMIRKDKAEGGTLYKHCRHKLKHRTRPVGGKRISIPNRTSISERPTEADGKRFGDFEMDTIVGRGNHGAIVTLIERSTNMLFMRKLKNGKNAKELARTVIHLLSPFKDHIKSITTDNGTEFACHEMITKSLGVTIYFADPYASWQKGAIENANGLIRQYVPKKETFEHISQQQITKYSKKINMRPRKKLDFKTPQDCFYELIK
ncbi:IS30 family transposase [Prevotella jejuni]|jgi:IS30 family transposase|uniref:IS30 family transposase n=1 Tax=Prevotella jejuni TaxID=1177574 RepID=UPI001BA7B145|nr:IS30 family transposase [Prevotella jejuni]QUB77345.1 IS30 family transposase [Prevotella jejuni]